MARSRENTASADVNSLPSWNFTPLRRFIRNWVGVTCCQDVASTGSGLNVLLL